MRRTLTLLTIAFVFAPLAQATDGVIEISQSKVLAAGGHFPYVISASGSYRLTSNLDVTNDPGNATLAQDRTAISVGTTAPVTIDLNGFTISGPTNCMGSGAALNCSPTGSGSGIVMASGLTTTSLTIRNGTVKGMGFGGISIQSLSSLVERVIAIANGNVGIAALRVVDCEARTNNLQGISATVVVNSRAVGNKTDGISASDLAQGNTSDSNGGVGIIGGSGVLAMGNSASGNTSFGLSITTSSGYVGNVFFANNSSNAQVSGGTQIGQNLCKGTITCP